MKNINSNHVEKTLSVDDVHLEWEGDYRTPENEIFYEHVFDKIADILGTNNHSFILDVGCGICAHSIRLAKRNYNVVAIDFSKNILDSASANISQYKLDNRIKVQQENILSMSFPDESFDYILCWGVLMHIPDIQQAIAELDRVLNRGGCIIISEVNKNSFQSIFLRTIKSLFRLEKAELLYTQAGIEYWETKSSGKLVTRQSNIKWLKDRFTNNNYIVIRHIPGQFTEIYNRIKSPLLRKIIHLFNMIWFEFIKLPGPAFGNIIILKKAG
ncbi:MAG: hypothetical protein A3H98_13765 [Bacteroidetes bacterium RIFCSPLOWO2_02_FULL_36_8]|nr:MAG: hypothetical protein A3H98_13765 [Bacteroidetes bacterium RIFCSPLOWO2_02_FULL_36_8]